MVWYGWCGWLYLGCWWGDRGILSFGCMILGVILGISGGCDGSVGWFLVMLWCSCNFSGSGFLMNLSRVICFGSSLWVFLGLVLGLIVFCVLACIWG